MTSDAPGRVNLTSRQLELLLALVVQESTRRGWTEQADLAHARGVLGSAESEEFAVLDFLLDDELHRRQL